MEQGPGRQVSSRRPSSPSSRPPTASITPFHCSPIVGGRRPAGPGGPAGPERPKRLSAPAGLFLSVGGRLAPPIIRDSLDTLSPGSEAGREETQGARPGRPPGKKAPKAAAEPHRSDVTPIAQPPPHWSAPASQKPPAAMKRRKRKMGMYNLVPKKKVKAVKQQSKEVKKSPTAPEDPAVAPEDPAVAPEDPAVAPEDPAAAPEDPAAAPEDPAAAPEDPAAAPEDPAAAPEDPAAAPEDPAVAPEDGEPPAIRTDPLKEEEEEEERAGGHVEYTELALDCLDLKAQVELLSPPLSGAAAEVEVTESELAEELPLCCCRMETPGGGGGASADQTCMAMESNNGTLSRCQRRAMKQELMRPSNTVHLLVLCQDHRAGMVQHQCCPGCGLFCRAGSFLECRPYGNISHRFHRDCASILRDRRFCPHCGEDAAGAVEVLAARAEPSPSVPRSNPGPSLPTAATLPSVPATPAVPQTLRAKKSSEPQLEREHSPGRLKDETLGPTERPPKESLEHILMALDDENLKPKKVKYSTRQLYVSAKQGDLQKVIHLLVDGKDPNFLMDGQNRRTPLHAAAAKGHHEVCHMLVQAGANLDMLDGEQRTPLMSACENNQLDTVKYLIRAGAAVGHKDVLGFTCLHLASKLGHYDVIQHLLSKASKHINCQDDGGWTPITWATEYKHVDLVLLLLDKGADVNIRDKEENVCLHWAALSGSDDIAQALLDARCDLNAINVHGDTPLHVAARENHLECVVLFLSRGADAALRNGEGHSALDCSVSGSKVWTALSANRKLTDARRGRDRLGERVLSRDLSRGYESVPISCVNGVDGEPCPHNFKYVPDSCVTSPISVDKDITRLQHCSCSDHCVSSSCVCGQLSLRCWYDSDGRLPQDFCQREPPVLFECNHACSCWRTCRNRVVQNGLRVQLQLFRTPRMGWGVRALQDVPQGTFVCEYVGEIISDAEADKRENDSFLFTLDNKVGDVHCIDARLFGNIGRFINHLCEPNLLAVRVFTMHQDRRFPRIAFFSSRTIRAGDQIGFDYGDHYWRVKRKFFSCQCGAPKCRHSAGGPQELRPDP